MRNRFLMALLSEVFLQIINQTSNLWALQTYPLVDQQQTTIKISKSELNRISVAGDRIQQIFGADESFDVQSDDEGGQIFVRLLDPDQRDARTLTLITESGLTHDLTLTPENLPFQSILLKPGSDSRKPESILSKASLDVEHLSKLIQAMAAGNPFEGYGLSKLKHADRSYPEPLKIHPHVLYKGENREGRIYTLQNTGNQTIPLSEEILALPGDLALSLSTNHLEPGSLGTLLVISYKSSAKENF